MKIKDARSLSQDAKETLRMRAVQAVLDGTSQTEAAQLFGVQRQTVNRWVQTYRRSGNKALAAKRKGRPPGSGQRLKGWQASRLIRIIRDKTPDQLKLPFLLWTRAAVREWIANEFQVHVSERTVGRWLKRWGFTPQKPVRRAWERDDREVRTWLEKEYPRIRREARQEKAEIHWGDEMGLRSDHQAGRSYSPKGKTPVIEGTGKRFGCNVISTVTNRGTLRFMVFSKRFTVDVLLQFLQRLVRSISHKVYLIVDGHPVHKAKRVKQWVEKHRKKIRLIALPAYSPELNPDEYLNQDVKSNAVGKRRAVNREDLMADVRGYLRSTQKQPHIVKNYFHAPPVRYAME
jgi:transposase